MKMTTGVKVVRFLGVVALCASAGCAPPGPTPNVAPTDPQNLPGADHSVTKANGTQPLVMKMRAVKMEGGAEAPFQINDALHSGQRIAYYVTTDQPAYVYVMQFMSDGTHPLLFPDKGDQRVEGHQETRVPSGNMYFELDASPGAENVYVIATREPLKSVDGELAELVSDVRTSPGGASDLGPQTSGTDPGPATPPTPAGANGPPPKVEALVPTKPAASVALPRPPKPASAYMAMLKTRSVQIDPCEAAAGVKCRGLKLVGRSYEGVADERGVVVLHFPFQHLR
jgi:hypothetical protein